MSKVLVFIAIIILVGLALVVGAFWLKNSNSYVPENPGQIACTQEAKACPDGSYVARTGPNCEFAKCPELKNTGDVNIKSGIMGIVLLGPTCPVQKEPPDPQCADKEYQTNLVVTSSDGRQIIAQFSSDEFGNFKVNLVPGQYQVTSADQTKPFPRCSSSGVFSVSKDKFNDITVYCDTGIR